MGLPEEIVNNMKKFQAHNDIPVFLKGGPADKVLFGITAGLSVIGLLGIAHLVYDMGFSKKKA